MSVIRDLTLDDIPQLLSFFKEVGQESGWSSKFEFNPEHIAASLVHFIQQENILAIGVSPKEGGAIGGILIAEIMSPWYTPTAHAFEKVFYVHPSMRRGGYAGKLIEFYKKWASRNGAKEIVIGNGLGIQPEGVRSLCEQQQFVPVGYIFKHR